MAKKATAKSSGGKSKSSGSSGSSGSRGGGGKSVAVVQRQSSGGGKSGPDTGEMFIKLLQSPIVAELVAVAATAALAALAEHGFTSSGGTTRGKRAGKAVKEAGKAAAAAVGRRLSNEIDEIRKAAGSSKGGAKA